VLRRLLNTWRNLARRESTERELDAELNAALALLADEKVRSGLSPKEAWRAAQVEFGSVAAVKDDVRDARAGLLLDTVLRDLRYGVRLLWTSPTFSLAAILTIALGTGPNAAVFQVVNALRLRPLPVVDAHELVSVGIDRHGVAQRGRRETGRSVFTEPLWREIQQRQQAFASVFAWGSGRWDLSTQGEIAWADGFYVSGSYFAALGVRPHVGRVLTEADDRAACGSPSAVLSYEFWRRRYGGDPAVVGTRITLDRQWFDIVGVAQRGFMGVESGRSFDVALPICAEPMMRGREAGTGRADVWWLDVIGRLEPSWTLERAQAHLRVISPRAFAATVPAAYEPRSASDYAAFTLTASSARGGVSMLPPIAFAALWVLLGATGLVLLLTCANVANLILARSAARNREFAVRLAIGATRRRLIGQVIAENSLIAAAGTVCGLLLAGWLGRSLVAYLNSGSLPVRIAMELTADWRVFGLSAAGAALVCILCGLGPAIRAVRQDPASAMTPSGRSSTDGRDALRLRRALVVAQIASSIVLVVGALLSVQTLRNLGSVDLGFDPELVVARVDLRRSAIEPEARMPAFQRIVAELEKVPGVEGAAETVVVPLSGADWNGQIVISEGQAGDAHFNAVGTDYFRVMGTPLLRGRSFAPTDRPSAPRVAIVNETFARRYFGSADPIGKFFRTDTGRVYTVIGQVTDSRFLDLGGQSLPIAYLAASQEMIPAPAALPVLVRPGSAGVSTAALTRAIVAAAPAAGVSYQDMSRNVDTLLLLPRLVAWMSGLFGLLAALIASIGVYGIMSYLVTRRRLEIGLRLALGARPGSVVRMILSESATLLAVGVACGAGLAVVALQPAAGLLYGVRPLDPASFAIGTVGLAIVTMLAVWAPARRASGIAPMAALRE
jgi:putative ABC transport system permease protein